MTIGRIPSIEGGIQPTIFDAKADILTATAADTPARLAVGNNGDTLVADSAATTGLRWQANFAAGKNAIINGDFRINQRSFSSTTSVGSYGFDRWWYTGSGSGPLTYSTQNFTLGTAPVAGYEGTNFARIVTANQSASGDFCFLSQRIESVRTFAGQTVTVSFWAKAASGTPKIAVELEQGVGTGGSPSGGAFNYAGQVTLSTSWARYSVTVALSALTGWTLGTNNNNYLGLNLWVSAGSTYNSRTGSLGVQNGTFDIWGVQVEAGSVATAFQTATGTLQGELAACQRYYYLHAESTSQSIGIGTYYDSTTLLTLMQLPVTMRTTPTVENVSGTNYYQVIRNGGTDDFNAFTSLSRASNKALTLDCTSNISGTAGQAGIVMTNNASAKLAFTSEL